MQTRELCPGSVLQERAAGASSLVCTGLKSKPFCRLLLSIKVKPSRGFIKLKEDFDLEDSTASNAFLNIKSYSSETFIRSFQFKLLADITFTNQRLAKIGYVPNDLCTFCEERSETVHHLFYECSFSYSRFSCDVIIFQN